MALESKVLFSFIVFGSNHSEDRTHDSFQSFQMDWIFYWLSNSLFQSIMNWYLTSCFFQRYDIVCDIDSFAYLLCFFCVAFISWTGWLCQCGKIICVRAYMITDPLTFPLRYQSYAILVYLQVNFFSFSLILCSANA